jgi:hypothetical protein
MFPAASEAGDEAFASRGIVVAHSDIFYLVASVATASLPGTTYVMRLPGQGGTAVPVASFTSDLTLAGFASLADLLILGERSSDPAAPGYRVVGLPPRGGAPTVLANASGAITSIAVDEDSVYFSDEEATKRVAARGGAIEHVAAEASASIGVAGGSLLLAVTAKGIVESVALDNGQLDVLAKGRSLPALPMACGSAVCWLEGNTLPPVQGSNGALVQKAPGAAPKILAQGFDAFALGFDGRTFFVEVGGSGSLASFFRLSANGGAPAQMPEDGSSAGGVANAFTFDDECLYWQAYSLVGGGVFSISLDGADRF